MIDKTFFIKIGTSFVTKQKPYYKVKDKASNIKASNIVVEDGIEVLEECCFSHNRNIKNVSLPNSVFSIEGYAFENCSELETINIPKNIKIINRSTFDGCKKLLSINIPDSVEEICDYAFRDCYNLTSIVLPKNIKRIGKGAFAGCNNLTDIVIPQGVKQLSRNVFENCYKLSSISLPDGVEEICDYAFGQCKSLSSICIPKSVSRIGRNVFRYSGIKEPVVHNKSLVYPGCDVGEVFVVPDGVERIREDCFYRCMNLCKVIIPSSVKVIEKDAFYMCWNLDVVDIANKDIKVMKYAFPKHVKFHGAYQIDKVKVDNQIDTKQNSHNESLNIPLKHICLTQLEKDEYLKRCKRSKYKDDLILSNIEYLLRFGLPQPDEQYVFDSDYEFLCDGNIVSKVKESLEKDMPMTIEDWLNKFNDVVNNGCKEYFVTKHLYTLGREKKSI